VHSHATEVEAMFGPLVMLAVLALALALCGALANWCGLDSRDGFADQAHRPPRSNT
jgi:hypothetical protein